MEGALGGLWGHGGAQDARRADFGPQWLPILGPKTGQNWPKRHKRHKKCPDGLERRLGSELGLTVYQIYVSVDIHTPRSTKYDVERRAEIC